MRSRLFFIAFLGSILPVAALARTPNDPSFSQWAFTDVHAPKAWDITTGKKEVVVAIIDNGFDSLHPDLKDNVWHNTGEISSNGKDDDNNGFVDDSNGWDFAGNDNDPRPDDPALQNLEDGEVLHHATIVAGIIGGVGDNNRSGAGINWQVR